MGKYTRLVYVRPQVLITQLREIDVKYCYLPICHLCHANLLYQIAITKSKSLRKRYLCIECALRVYPKEYIVYLIEEHISKLSKGQRSKGYIHIFKQLLEQLNHAKLTHK
jgi:hypothetical protein